MCNYAVFLGRLACRSTHRCSIMLMSEDCEGHSRDHDPVVEAVLFPVSDFFRFFQIFLDEKSLSQPIFRWPVCCCLNLVSSQNGHQVELQQLCTPLIPFFSQVCCKFINCNVMLYCIAVNRQNVLSLCWLCKQIQNLYRFWR